MNFVIRVSSRMTNSGIRSSPATTLRGHRLPSSWRTDQEEASLGPESVIAKLVRLSLFLQQSREPVVHRGIEATSSTRRSG